MAVDVSGCGWVSKWNLVADGRWGKVLHGRIVVTRARVVMRGEEVEVRGILLGSVRRCSCAVVDMLVVVLGLEARIDGLEVVAWVDFQVYDQACLTTGFDGHWAVR